MKTKSLSLIALAGLLSDSAFLRFNKKDKKKGSEPAVDIIEFVKARKVNKKLAKNASKDWLRIVNQEGSREATIYIYDEISWFGILAEDVISQIQDLDVDTIHVRINSPGGSVFEGVAIANLLKAHKAKIVTYNDSLAASIATIIFLAGDERHVADNSLFMMHKPSSIVWGTADEMRQEAEVLDMIEGTLLTTYENASNLERSELTDMIDAETWLDAEQCVEHGFADEEFEASQMAAKADRSKFDFSAFLNAPETASRKNKSATKTSPPKGDEGPVNETPPLALLELEAEALQLNQN
jgi:ATP-dependent Clp protease protease subunit